VTFPARLHPYVCLACRKSFKRKWIEEFQAGMGMPDKTCPHCGGVAIGLSRNFKAPPMNDIQQWAKVAYLIKNGFRFHHQYDESGQAVPYPATLADAKKFVLLYGSSRYSAH
jgi:DNA-directed RNA polymerase subunit RPC12/RpoP